VDLGGFYAGRAVFLMLGGPSLTTNRLELLRTPGIVTMGVNNMWSVYRPNLWCCVDPPGHFIDTGWKDASVIKFVPQGCEKTKLHIKKKDGTFGLSTFTTNQMPGVLYFPRNSRFDHEKYLTEPTINWGNNGKAKDSLGIKGSRSVMLAAVKLAYYLGFKNVYLLGCDFNMKQRPGKVTPGNYAFKQGRTVSSVKGNNRSYRVLNQRFGALKLSFHKAGFNVFNCNPNSGLKVFPTVKFPEAIAKASAEAVKIVNTEGWYSHGKIKGPDKKKK